MKKVAIVAAMLALLCTLSYGQAYQQVAFTNQATAAFSPTLKNFNQAAHYLTFCNAGTGTAQIQLVGSRDSNTADGVVISNIGTVAPGPGSCGSIYGGGYYFAVWAQILNVAGAPSISATYSASVGPLAFPPNVGTTFPPSTPVCSNFNYTTALTSSYTTIIPAPPAPFSRTLICAIVVDGNQIAGAGAGLFIHTSSVGVFFTHSFTAGNSTFIWGQGGGPVFIDTAAADVVQALISGVTGGTVSLTVTYSYY